MCNRFKHGTRYLCIETLHDTSLICVSFRSAFINLIFKMWVTWSYLRRPVGHWLGFRVGIRILSCPRVE